MRRGLVKGKHCRNEGEELNQTRRDRRGDHTARVVDDHRQGHDRRLAHALAQGRRRCAAGTHGDGGPDGQPQQGDDRGAHSLRPTYHQADGEENEQGGDPPRKIDATRVATIG